MNEIRRIRQELGWSQVRMAEEMGVDQSRVSKWETGTYRVTKPILLAAESLLAKFGEREDAA